MGERGFGGTGPTVPPTLTGQSAVGGRGLVETVRGSDPCSREKSDALCDLKQDWLTGRASGHQTSRSGRGPGFRAQGSAHLPASHEASQPHRQPQCRRPGLSPAPHRGPHWGDAAGCQGSSV